MSLSSYMVNQMDDQLKRWTQAIETLPDSYLTDQRAELQRQCEARSGVSPAALVLRLLDAEVAKRTELAIR